MLCPNIERAFGLLGFSLRQQAVRIFRGVKPAFLIRHVSAYIVEDIAGSLLEKGIARDLDRAEIRHGKPPLVVKNFLEMRGVAKLDGRVGVKTAADVIVNPALGHFTQREESHLERMLALF